MDLAQNFGTNALKHGIYKSAFTSEELNFAEQHSQDSLAEIVTEQILILRIISARIIKSVQEPNPDNAKLIDTAAQCANRIRQLTETLSQLGQPPAETTIDTVLDKLAAVIGVKL